MTGSPGSKSGMFAVSFRFVGELPKDDDVGWEVGVR